MCKNFSRIQCIIPPYINKKLVDSPDPKISKAAVNNKFRSYRFRSDRDFFKDTTTQEKVMLGAIAMRPKPATPVIQVYNCKRAASTNKSPLVWKTGDAKKPADKDAKNVIEGAEATWKFYNEAFGRNSIDNRGLILQQYIHYDKKYENAFWDGRRMIFGDGDGKIFGSFTTDLDIIAHELTHAVVQYEANLNYQNQSGALNESLADVFGIMIKQKTLNLDVKKSDWLVGANILLGNKYCLRNVKEPGSAYKNHPELGDDPQPATMDAFMKLENTEEGDWGGVHYNSGIPNFAFYVCAYNLGGFSWEKAGRIWYGALTDTDNLSKDATFKDMRRVTIKSAEKLFGKNSLEVKAVKQGWDAAKVK